METKGLIYRYRRLWHDLPPHNKKAKPLDPQPDFKVKFKAGNWVRFTDPVLAKCYGEMVGKVKFVVATATGRERWYEIEHGATMHHVPEHLIIARMVDKTQ